MLPRGLLDSQRLPLDRFLGGFWSPFLAKSNAIVPILQTATLESLPFLPLLEWGRTPPEQKMCLYVAHTQIRNGLPDPPHALVRREQDEVSFKRLGGYPDIVFVKLQ